MNIVTQLLVVQPQQVLRYSPEVTKLILNKSSEINGLSRSQKAIVSKIYQNMNILCKLQKKQIKQLLKQFKQYACYQQLLSQFLFTPKINNYILINKQEANVKIDSNVLRNRSTTLQTKQQKCVEVQYRVEFTISNINKKKVMKPVVLIIYKMDTGIQIKVYYSIEQFNHLRLKVAESIKQIYAIQLRTLF